MPNATDYEIEAAIEDAVSSLLTTAGLATATQRDTGELSTPRAEVQFVLGSMRSDTITGDSTDGFYYDGFDGQLQGAVITTRSVDGSNHSTNVGKARYELRNRGAFTSSVLPNHVINDIVLTASSVNIESELNLDVTTDTYSIALRFR